MNASNEIKKRGLASTISADDCNEIAVFKRKIYIVERLFFGNRSRIEGF